MKKVINKILFNIGYMAAWIHDKTHPDLYRPVRRTECDTRRVEVLF
jgi:hypothetical protein